MINHTPFLQPYHMIMENGTRVYIEDVCHKCGWKVDQEDSIETSNSYMYGKANVKHYHRFCYNKETTHDKIWSGMYDR